jgi:hypothetical protein
MIQMQPNRRLLRAWLLLPKMSDETCAKLNKGFLALLWLSVCVSAGQKLFAMSAAQYFVDRVGYTPRDLA